MSTSESKDESKPFIFKYASLLIRLSSKYKTIPFNWPIIEPNNLIKNPLIQTQKRFFWYCVSFWQLIYTSFLYISLYLHFESYVQHREFVAGVLHITWSCGHSIAVIVRIHQIRKENEMCFAFNEMMQFVAKSIESEPKCADEYLKRWKLFDKIMALLLPFIISCAICYSGLVLIYPYHHRYMYLLLLPSNVQLTWGVKFGFFFCELAYILGIWTAYFIDNFLSLFLIDNLGTALNLLNKKKMEGKRSVHSLVKTYQQIHILNILYQQGFSGPFGMPGQKFTVTITALGAVSGCILFAAVINPLVTLTLYLGSITLVGMIGFLLPLSARVSIRSSKFSFPNFVHENNIRCSESQKLICACKPFAIRIGDLYYIHVHTTLTFLNIFTTNLINILIALSFYTAK